MYRDYEIEVSRKVVEVFKTSHFSTSWSYNKTVYGSRKRQAYIEYKVSICLEVVIVESSFPAGKKLKLEQIEALSEYFDGDFDDTQVMQTLDLDPQEYYELKLEVRRNRDKK